MNKPDWTTIKSDYVETAMTLAEVQAKHNIPRGTLSARATRQGWNDEKQRFAAILEQQRREIVLAKRAAEQEQFDSTVLKLVNGQLIAIARQLQDGTINASQVLKLANALKTVQTVGCTALGKVA
jgi:hypothetical protein